MFKVILNDGQTEMPKDDIFYIIAKEGVYLKKKLGVMESVAPVKNISILESVNSMAKMHITKIPGRWIAKVMTFFQAVYKEYRSEAIVLLFYDEETGSHKIIPPMQKVAGASCDYDKGITIEGMTMIGTIHSHASMSAFHSGVDDKDEEHFDGLHITLGDLDEAYPSISASIVANGYRIMVDPDEYIDKLVLMAETNPVENKPVRVVYKWVDGELVKDEQATSKYVYGGHKKFDRRYDVLVSPHERIFNKKWLKMVEKGVYTYKSWRQGLYGYGAHGYQGRGRGCDWGQHYDAHAWRKPGQGVLPGFEVGTRVSPQNAGHLTKESLLKFPPHTKEGEFVPCATCAYRECLSTSETDIDDLIDDATYQCNQCGELVIDDVVEDPICLNCQTDEHLILIVNDNLLDSYTPSDKFDHLFEKDQSKVVEDSNYITCATCGNKFHLPDDDAICPFCYSLVKQVTLLEDATESQMKKDSGALLDPEAEEANNAILEAAKQVDETIERIPEPGSSSIPIPEQAIEPEGKASLLDVFRKVFGEKK